MLESRHRHDYKSYMDQNGEYYSVDGGLDYVRRSLNKVPARDACVYSDAGHEEIRERLKWGTYGINRDEPLHWILLKQMTTEHIEKILETQKHIRPYVKVVFENELKYRKERDAQNNKSASEDSQAG